MVLLSSTGESIYQFVVVIFVFVLILAATYFTTRWMAGYQKTKTISQNLSVVETLKLSQNKYLLLVSVGKDKFYLLAIGKDEVNLIGEVTRDELKDLKIENPEDIPTFKGDFESVLSKVKDRIPKK